jgi:hypothetical protein
VNFARRQIECAPRRVRIEWHDSVEQREAMSLLVDTAGRRKLVGRLGDVR